jgi:diguanylate cyclase (GGDEF)-like protein
MQSIEFMAQRLLGSSSIPGREELPISPTNEPVAVDAQGDISSEQNDVFVGDYERSPASNSPRQSSILVVDDHPANLSLLMQILTSNGYKVRVSPNANLALRSIILMVPDLILLDINMPDIDGYTLCRQLKADPRTKEISVIFISALGEPWDKVRGFNLGAVDYITKPFEPVEVLVRIEQHLRWQESQLQLKVQNARLKLLLSTARAINGAEDMDSALRVVLTQICKSLGWDMGQAWLPDADNNFLVCSPGYYVNDRSLKGFHDQTKELHFTPGLGMAGQVWSSQKPKCIENLATASAGEFASPQNALAVGIRGAVGIPIICQQRVMAVLSFFQKEPLVIKEDTMELLMAVADQLGSLIQHKQDEKKLRLLNLELQKLAELDGLTKVANRRRFDDYLAQEWKRSLREEQPLSLILCDVDYFKAYNDCYGHLAGDECLQQVAKAMNDYVKRPADLVARYGGEEFVVLLPNTPVSGARRVASTLQDQIQSLHIPHAKSLVKPYVTMSLGIASVIPRPDLSLEDLIQSADMALYEAKRQGRDRLVINSIVKLPA